METRRIVSCDGGGGALGHPKVYINLDKAGEPNVCPYCELPCASFVSERDKVLTEDV